MDAIGRSPFLNVLVRQCVQLMIEADYYIAYRRGVSNLEFDDIECTIWEGCITVRLLGAMALLMHRQAVLCGELPEDAASGFTPQGMRPQRPQDVPGLRNAIPARLVDLWERSRAFHDRVARVVGASQ